MNGLACFGIALDCTDDPLKVALRRRYAQNRFPWKLVFSDPYDGLTHHLDDLFDSFCCEKVGKIGVESWLTPTPTLDDLSLITPVNYTVFMDGNGCREYSSKVEYFVESRVSPGIPVMIAADHSMTGGVLSGLKRRYAPKDVTVFILDSHFDAFSIRQTANVVKYSKEKYPHYMNVLCGSEFPTLDIDHISIPESYNCSTFLRYLLREGTILPENLVVIGVSDYPTEELGRNVYTKEYADAYFEYERNGVVFIPKCDLQRGNIDKILDGVLGDRETPCAYVSLDVDVGAVSAIQGARFMNVVGISEKLLYTLMSSLGKRISQYEKKLVGFDVCEIDAYLAGRCLNDRIDDRTYEVVSKAVRLFLGQPAATEEDHAGAGKTHAST